MPDMFAETAEECVLEGPALLFGAEDFFFEFLQLRGDVPLRIRESLLANPHVRDTLKVGLSDLEKIPEDFVVFDLEACDPGGFALRGLEGLCWYLDLPDVLALVF